MEQWVDINDFENYQVNNLGRVRNKKGRILIPENDKGYLQVCLWKNNKGYQRKIHKLVLENFKGKKEGYTVNHINGIATDNRLKNLEWVTLKDNIKKAYKNNQMKPDRRSYLVILTNKITNEEFAIKSCRKASKFLNKNKEYIRENLRNNKFENKDYKWELICKN